MAWSFVDDFRRRVALDASVLINLNASTSAATIIGALPNRIAVTDIVLDELKRSSALARDDAVLAADLMRSGLVEAVSLGPEGYRHFEALVSGEAASTLDDGEAATIAWAIEQESIAAIDERKARTIVKAYAPALPVASTVDILFHDDVQAALGRSKLNDAVFLALKDGRMRVAEAQMAQVTALLTPDQLEQCPSLPARFRSP